MLQYFGVIPIYECMRYNLYRLYAPSFWADMYASVAKKTPGLDRASVLASWLKTVRRCLWTGLVHTRAVSPSFEIPDAMTMASLSCRRLAVLRVMCRCDCQYASE